MKQMKKTGLLFTGIIFCLQMSAQTGPTASEIIEKSREASKISGMEVLSTLKIFDNRGRERTRETSMASRLFDKGETEKRIIRFRSPADVEGTGILIFDYEEKNDDMWIYMPALRKTRRIVSTEKGKSFMGSEFSNADMSAPSMDYFNTRLSGTEAVDGADCWKLELIPVTDNIADEFGFSKKITWIGKEDYVTRKAEYYDLDGELLKVLTASGIKNVDPAAKKYLATRMEMHNIQSGRKSVFIMDNIQFNPQVSEDYFTISYLER